MSFGQREAGAYTLRRILKDIKLAQEYGIHMHNDITLNEMPRLCPWFVLINYI